MASEVSSSVPRFYTVQRLIQSEETNAIIKYLRKNPNSTIDKVAKHLQKEKICSRLTTLSVIEKLIAIEMIKDDRQGKYFHSLTYNKDFDFIGMASVILKKDIDEILNIFDRFVYTRGSPTEEEVKNLHDFLDDIIDEHYKLKIKKKKS